MNPKKKAKSQLFYIFFGNALSSLLKSGKWLRSSFCCSPWLLLLLLLLFLLLLSKESNCNDNHGYGVQIFGAYVLVIIAAVAAAVAAVSATDPVIVDDLLDQLCLIHRASISNFLLIVEKNVFFTIKNLKSFGRVLF